MASVGVSVFVLALTAAPRAAPDSLVIALPAASVAGQLVLALVVIQLVLLPGACALLARAGRSDRIARAHVHRIRRA
jgi:hypothetical protein